ncbi:polysaccharide biosynthesis/export family protein [Microvirga sp. 0TCS3.31]
MATDESQTVQMMSVWTAALRSLTTVWTAASIIAFSTLLPGHALAERNILVPQMKLRINIVQWMPSKGEYQRWDAISGEFVVSAEGNITLPLVGTINVTTFDARELTSEIVARFKSKAGLLEAPDATVEVVEYPPIYLVGSVAAPGAKPFRPGLTVLQAVSLGGGVFRSESNSGLAGQVATVGDLEDVRNQILRHTARLSRLRAEMAGDKEISFPPEIKITSDEVTLTEIIAQERIIFKARRDALARQLQNLAELQRLLSSEIQILGQKSEALEANIKISENELSDVKSLVDRGIATVSRRSELERAVAGLRSDRLDQITATMRGRQNLSEAMRSEVGLRDKFQTDVSTELQDVQASLERAKIKEDVLKKTLMLTPSTDLDGVMPSSRFNSEMSFTIVRKMQEKVEEFAASERTMLAPNDVVKVTLVERSKRSASASGVASVERR